MSAADAPVLPYGRQLVEEDDIAAVAAALRGDFLTTGAEVAAFEAALAARLEAKHAVVCSSGTAALHLSALALGLGPGDAVVVPAVTFLATANCARYVGSEVVFADVDPDTGLLTEATLSAALSRGGEAVRAIYPVHLNGQAAAPEMVAALAADRGLAVVEDACHALGGHYVAADGAKVVVGSCRHARMSVFSTHPTKVVTTGEGGAVTTNDPVLAARLARLRNHGIVREAAAFENHAMATDESGRPNPWYHEMPAPGFNYRLSDIHCALGRSQLGKLDRFIARRRALARRYDRALAPLGNLVRPVPRAAGAGHAFHLYAVLIDFAAAGLSRAALMAALRDRGVGSQVHYIPVHRQPYYQARYGPLDLPGAERYYARVLSLPLFPSLAEADVDRVVAALTEVLGTG